jgi:hypothetical protein
VSQLLSKKKFTAFSLLGMSFGFILLLGNVVSARAVAPPARQEEKPPIPSDLFFEFKPVPDEENAIFSWRRAEKLKVSLPEGLDTTIQYCWTPTARRPSEADFAALQSWYQRNKEALDVFNASIAKAKAQWPEQDPENPQPEMNALLHFTKVRLFEADSLAHDKKFTNAVESLETSLKLAQRGIEGNAAFIHYLVSARARSWVQSAMLRMTSHRDMSLPLMERLLKDLPSLDSETNSYAQVLRVEFTRYAYHTPDLKRLAETYSKMPITNLLFYPDELRRPLKVLLDPSLVAVHPKPLDETAGLNRDIRCYRAFRTNSVGAWTNRDESFLAEDAEIIEKLTEDIKPLMELVKDEPLPLSRQAAERARKAYLRLENPVGRIFAGSLSTFVESDQKVFFSRTEREAMRAMIALLIFERRKGVSPGKLSDLVDAKILDSVPFDFLANSPMSYSRERRIVWSVGEDAENDGGESEDGKFHWYTGDAVWHIPTIN